MSKYRKYKEINTSLLTNTDSKSALYWLGFIAADGSVNKTRLTIELSDKDKDHLKKLKRYLEITNPIRPVIQKANGKTYKSHKIDIYSKKLINSIGRFGIVSNKSLTLTFPDTLKENKNVASFIRGYIDGDGGFYVKNGKVKIYITGTLDMLYNINNILVINSKLPKEYLRKPMRKDGRVFTLEYASLDISKQIISWLYKDIHSKNGLCLSRKFSIIKQFISKDITDLTNSKTQIGQTKQKSFTAKQLAALYDEFGTLSGVANHLNCDQRTIKKYFNKYGLQYKKQVPKTKKYHISKQDLLSNYNSIKSIRGLARLYGCSRTVIKSRLLEYLKKE